jgi:hypothetical protein
MLADRQSDRPRAGPEAHLSARESLAARTYFAVIASSDHLVRGEHIWTCAGSGRYQSAAKKIVVRIHPNGS